MALDRPLNQDFSKLRIAAQEKPIEQPLVGRVVTWHGEFRLVAGVYDESAALYGSGRIGLRRPERTRSDGPSWQSACVVASGVTLALEAVEQPANEMVRVVGLEPTLLSELDFESSASTNSTTPAQAQPRWSKDRSPPFQPRCMCALSTFGDDRVPERQLRPLVRN